MGFIKTATRQYSVPFFLLWVILLTFFFSILFIIRSAGIENFVQATANLKYLGNSEFCIFDNDCTVSDNSCYAVNVFYKDVPYIGSKFTDTNNLDSCQPIETGVTCVKNKCQAL